MASERWPVPLGVDGSRAGVGFGVWTRRSVSRVVAGPSQPASQPPVMTQAARPAAGSLRSGSLPSRPPAAAGAPPRGPPAHVRLVPPCTAAALVALTRLWRSSRSSVRVPLAVLINFSLSPLIKAVGFVYL